MCVRTCIWIKPSLECCLQTFQTSNHRGVRGRGQVKRRVSIAHSDPVRLLLLLQVWPPGLGRRSRLGQWGACSRTRGSSEGAELGRSRGGQRGAWAAAPGCDLCRVPAARPPEKGLFSGSPAVLWTLGAEEDSPSSLRQRGCLLWHREAWTPGPALHPVP